MAKAYSDEKKSIEEAKEANWLKHFAEYGRGVSMYRTTEIYELILDGIPDKLRCELWLIFSGAIHQVRINISIGFSINQWILNGMNI